MECNIYIHNQVNGSLMLSLSISKNKTKQVTHVTKVLNVRKIKLQIGK